MKKRNSIKHEEKSSYVHKVIYNVTRNIGMLLKVPRTSQQYPNTLPEIVTALEQRTTKLKISRVMWGFPDVGWVKYNIDGASRGP